MQRRDEYHRHLESEQWRELRKLAMARSKGWCELLFEQHIDSQSHQPRIW